MADKVFGVEKLNGTNYYNWKFKVKMLLIKDGLWSTIDEPAQDTAAWNKLNLDAFAIISLTVEDNQLIYIRNETTAKAAWNNLKEQHQRVSLNSKVTLMRSICKMSFKEGGNMECHIKDMMELFDKLRTIDDKNFSEDWQVSMLLSSLPQSYDMLITALEVRDNVDLTLSVVKNKLMEEQSRQLSRDGGAGDAAFKFNMTCYFCKKSGHIKKDCPKFKEWLKKKHAKMIMQEDVSDALDPRYVLMSSGGAKESKWIVDSGASCHIACDRSLFKFFDDTDEKQIITVANGNTCKSKGRGTCEVKVSKSILEIKDVFFVPEFNSNLLSVQKMTEKGLDLSFEKNFCVAKKDCKVVFKAFIENGLYTLYSTFEQIFSVNNLNKGCIHYWHRVLGHCNIDYIRKSVEGKLVTGIEICDCRKYSSCCEVCVQGKFSKGSFPKESLSKSKHCFDLVHTDVCGPITPTTFSGFRYFVTFIDDYSRYCTVYLIKSKDEVISKIFQFWNYVKNQTGSFPKIIRSDRGGEYTSLKLKNFFETCGTEIQYTVPYCPQQNGVAERKNRTLIEMVKCMLIDSGLEKCLWGEALIMSNFLQNNIYNRSIDTTPFKLRFGSNPYFQKLIPFGSECMVHIPKEKRKKLDNTSEKKIFIGYDLQSKGYRVYDVVSKKVQICRDIVVVNSGNKDVSKCNFLEKTKDVVYFPFKEICNVEQSSDLNVDPTICEENDTEFVESTSDDEFLDADTNDINTNYPKRISSRSNKGIPPTRYSANVLTINKDPSNFNEAISIKEEKPYWIKAMQEEMDSILLNDTWTLVDLPPGRKVVGCKWVFKKKLNENGDVERFKARIVAQGFSQKYGVDYDAVFAPVVRQTTFRILLSVAGKEHLHVYHFDVMTAFLNGDLEETIYMRQPEGFVSKESPSKVCLLKKSLYGLKQAARSWNQCIHKVFTDLLFKQSLMDPCLYLYENEYGTTYILVYVDDIIIGSKSTKFIHYIYEKLSRKFKINNLGPIKYYLGMEVKTDTFGNFSINQSQYINKLVCNFGLSDAKISDVPINPAFNKCNDSEALLNNELYQKAIGSLLYLSVNTRPDIAASVALLAQKTQTPSCEDWNEVKRLIRYLKGTLTLQLRLSTQDKDASLIGYVDADWGENRVDRKSHSGYAFFINGGLISWCCRKQSCVSLSTAEAEYIAICEAAKEIKYIYNLLNEMSISVCKPITIMEDNQSCIKMINNEKFNARSKHIDIRYHFVKDLCNSKFIKLEYCSSENNISDILTKPLTKNRLLHLRNYLGLI